MKTLQDIMDASDEELIAYWNSGDGNRQYKKIPEEGREQFVKWCIEMMEDLAAEEENGGPIKHKPIDHAMSFQSIVTMAANKNSVKSEAAEKELNEYSKTAYGPATKENVEAATFEVKARPSNAAGIAASWQNPGVAAARLTRNGTSVTVDGVTSEYKSVAEAFRALTLPVEKHIRFRMRLKASGAEIFEHGGKQYHFRII
jgi:hypothetical protein